ncbi:hypothetical protein QBC34DRAFT_83670 [Podospora aff. communis PSN243]|uniref:Secreted protein n=1 Tax=Podospora aff. communis PSN243 TaxID=3040156 RepID=A0AAV9GMQ0_9PEZI|nr:hypothetical protein QBC34DRAFT_83670 [Podospora aff. communis PSN243]
MPLQFLLISFHQCTATISEAVVFACGDGVLARAPKMTTLATTTGVCTHNDNTPPKHGKDLKSAELAQIEPPFQSSKNSTYSVSLTAHTSRRLASTVNIVIQDFDGTQFLFFIFWDRSFNEDHSGDTTSYLYQPLDCHVNCLISNKQQQSGRSTA